jgi:hypothetical protein
MDRPSDPSVSRIEGRRVETFRHRWRRGILVGAGLGLAVGLVVGIVTGSIVGGERAFWMATVACAVAGIGVGSFVGGLSRLESPRPGAEPTEVARPVLDEPNLTKDETPHRRG